MSSGAPLLPMPIVPPANASNIFAVMSPPVPCVTFPAEFNTTVPPAALIGAPTTMSPTVDVCRSTAYDMAPVDVTPLTDGMPAAETVPTVNPIVSTKENPNIPPELPAMVPIALPGSESSTLPVDTAETEGAVIGPLFWVISPPAESATVPLLVMPATEPTVPMVSAPEFTRVKPVDATPAAVLEIAFVGSFRLTDPFGALADKAATVIVAGFELLMACTMLPLAAVSTSVPDAAVIGALRLMLWFADKVRLFEFVQATGAATVIVPPRGALALEEVDTVTFPRPSSF